MVVVAKELPTPGDSHEQSVEELLNDNVPRDDPSSLPPPYASASSSAPQPPVAPASMPDLLANQGLSRVQPPIAHCNNVAIKRATGKVAGSYVIDPELVIPVEMLAPLGQDEERKNFKIDVGSSQIDVDLWVAPPSARAHDTKHPRTTIELRGHSVKLRLHNAGSRSFGLLACCTSGGNITLELPRSFRGPLTIKSRSDRVTFSPALEPMVATFSDYDDLRKCFVGDFKALEFGQGAWEGSMVEIEGPYSRIHLRFADEPEPVKTPTSSWGIWPFTSPTSPVAKV